MIEALSLATVAAALGGRLVGSDAPFSSVSIDSRRIAKGDLFVALTGPRFDGHDYLSDVAAKGAVAALVERESVAASIPQLVVADTRKALGQLGALNRQAFNGHVVAITGSSGKTTVKEMLASILFCFGPVLATRGNLNNELGVPLTLLEIASAHASAVIELGASGLGEIAYTASLARPHVSILNNAGTAHVGEFGGPDNIVKAKGEIIDGLPANGTAVLNKDDKAFGIWVERAGGRNVVSFGLSESADFRASDLTRDDRGCPCFRLKGPAGEAFVQLNLLGAHNVCNALAAAAAAHVLGASLADIVAGLQALQPVKGRAVARITSSGLRVIDDSYNANPASVRAAIDIVAGFAGRRVLALGDMGELGGWAQQSHKDVGAYAVGKVDALYAVGPLMAHAVEAFGQGGRHYPDQAALIADILREQAPSTTILIKGSRSAAMENVVVSLCGTAEEKH
ncbi:UDP-N-acetylmuramoyl-tripeptide--D-alanyl-D-alanine ligase [Pseudomonas matsuisoli]|uniref:UDP-N-acetylmuramoyl-tripeptide--D-alanyl-D-alanine ligase n=1 Tax=Pseudomonas matsuisoli TaxID=1515666 RepID=A0A917V132_9PSED|nr:UDP-N-acetylmuramoyl-tripeptide--D-alanyl-D-alanine ligase [Pseudomonas matsuisoli]GGK07685.1 UDP-N-acetylmuramoyl-tripeptide--D-alanyl-D-alanine ligase [Pseudomonas matsuisoli]